MGKRSNEKFPYDPSSPYSASKASADHLIKSFIRTFKLPAIISNCCNNYGPNQFPEKLIPKTIIRSIKNLKVPLYGDGTQIRSWIYVDDHCDGVLTAFLKGKSGESYNFSGNNEINNLVIVKKILELINKSEDLIEFVEDRPGHDFRYSMSSEKISKELGWKPKVGFEKGIQDTIKWYLDHEDYWKDTPSSIFNPTPWKNSKKT